MLLVGGSAAGVWSHERKGARIEVTVTPFDKLRAADKKAIAAEADGLGRFLDAPVSVSFHAPA